MYLLRELVAFSIITVILIQLVFLFDEPKVVETQEIIVKHKLYSMYANIDNIENIVECLATNIYFEARGESLDGKKAVAFVTLNRVESKDFPDDICSVVYQAKHSTWWKEARDRNVPLRNKCQFSWYCDGKSDRVINLDEYDSLYRLASEVIVGKHEDNTNGAIYYHADYVSPTWRLAFTKTTQIDDHIFYR